MSHCMGNDYSGFQASCHSMYFISMHQRNWQNTNLGIQFTQHHLGLEDLSDEPLEETKQQIGEQDVSQRKWLRMWTKLTLVGHQLFSYIWSGIPIIMINICGCFMNWDCSISVVTRLQFWWLGFSSQQEQEFFCHYIQSASGSHPALYKMCTGGSFPFVK
jgi:hypothetical protein